MESDYYETSSSSNYSDPRDNITDVCETAEHHGFYPEVATLLDQAVRVAAKHKSCEELVQHQPPIDDAELKKIAYWSCPQDVNVMKAYIDLTLHEDTEWRKAEMAVTGDKVKDMIQVGFMVTAIVGDTKVSFTFEKQNITSTACNACPKKLWCSHLIAAVLYRIEHASEVSVHGPMTETLLTLDRDQLQKLIQYAVNESPEDVLAKIFRRIDQIRDPHSEIRQRAGIVDPTFGIGDSLPSAWELTIDQLKESFESVCNERMNQFPYSFCEQTIKDNWIYKKYLQRVVDLVHRNQTEAAGRVLITLTTVAASRVQSSSPKSKLLLKTLERMCSLYILQFRGEAYSDLNLLCQTINKDLNFCWTENKWADVPPLSAVHTGEFRDVLGVLGGVQTSFFYEPLCVCFTPDPTQSFNELLNGAVEISSSTYDEPLPLMMLRFEALRLWRQSDDLEQQLVRLGFAILRKLAQMSFQLSILNDKERVSRMNETNQRNAQKRKAADDIDDTSNKRPRAPNTEYIQQRREGEKRVSTNAGSMNIHSSSFVVSGERMARDTRTKDVQAGNEETDEPFNVPDIMGDVDPKSQGKLEKIPCSVSLHSKNELLKSVFRESHSTESLHKETLSYCMLHTCCCIYEVLSRFENPNWIDNDALTLATLIALEFSRFRTTTNNRGIINTEEHAALTNLESQTRANYYSHSNSIRNQTFSSNLHKVYMKILCDCNLDGVCFFESGIPLLLISTLVETSFSDLSAEENRNIARCLCLNTLCHSYKPVSYFTSQSGGDSASCKEPAKQFEIVMSLFLKDIMDHPERQSWLIKLLEHYANVHDMEALHWLWNKVTDLSYDSEPREVQIALANFIMHCIKVQKDVEPYSYSVSKTWTLRMMIDFCSKLGLEFMESVFANWIEVAICFDSDSIDTLIGKMKEVLAGDVGLSADMKNSILQFVTGKFQHEVKSCELLTFLIPGDKFFDDTVSFIQENIANFTPEAMLFVAQMYRNHQIALSGNIPSGQVFSNEVEYFVKRALKSLGTGKQTCHSRLRSWGRGSFLPCSSPNEQILWVFKAFLVKQENIVVNNSLFTDVLAVVRDVFADDLPTILAVCASVDKQKLLLDKCKSAFGDRIHQLLINLVFDKLNYLTPKQYKEFVSDIKTIQGYFKNYVPGGQDAFVKLVNDIKRAHKNKRKLIDMLQFEYKCK